MGIVKMRSLFKEEKKTEDEKYNDKNIRINYLDRGYALHGTINYSKRFGRKRCKDAQI